MLEITSIPAFKDNYIWLLTNGARAAVVDPGDAAPVEAYLAERGLTLEIILVTHHHADHQGGVPDLAKHWRPIAFGPAKESITGCNRPLTGGETVDILGQEFQVIAVPGHTAGHIAYLAPGALFCGDTLFGAGCGRLFEGTPAQMADSLRRLAALPDATRVYCAHEYTEANLRFARAVEPRNQAIELRCAAVKSLREAGQSSVPSLLSDEKATNPFLRCSEPAVIAAARERGSAGDDAVSVFAAIRAWRNTF